ncbi:MAG TPA: hypothetical protein VEJ18_10310, partial [Planctomycetota bacterium]|nr:hypothetical protein [Planctomycetota bacterium]
MILIAALLLAQDPVLEDALRARPAGLAVVVGADDPALVLRIAEGGRRIVHVLEGDEGRRRALREAAAAGGRAGLVAIEAWDAPVLPHAEHLADLMVVARDIPEAEILRVLAPGGTALVRADGRWTALRKPRPDGFDDWTHWRHGPDGNMVSRDREVAAPQGLRWVAGPAQDAGGRKWYYDHVLLTANGRNIHVYEEAIVTRSSWNGVLLWTRPFKAHVFRETGLPVPADAPPKIKLGTRPSKVRPALAGDRLFAATEGRLIEIDARTGETTAEFG